MEYRYMQKRLIIFEILIRERCIEQTKDYKVFRKFISVCIINNQKVIGHTLYEMMK